MGRPVQFRLVRFMPQVVESSSDDERNSGTCVNLHFQALIVDTDESQQVFCSVFREDMKYVIHVMHLRGVTRSRACLVGMQLQTSEVCLYTTDFLLMFAGETSWSNMATLVTEMACGIMWQRHSPGECLPSQR